jgi:hypothetical protein
MLCHVIAAFKQSTVFMAHEPITTLRGQLLPYHLPSCRLLNGQGCQIMLNLSNSVAKPNLSRNVRAQLCF